MTTAPDPAAISLLEQCLRADRGRILSALIARVRDFQLAEDALHDAAASALIHWTNADLPTRPEAWLIRVAFRKAIERLRLIFTCCHPALDPKSRVALTLRTIAGLSTAARP